MIATVEFRDDGFIYVTIDSKTRMCTECAFRHEGEMKIVDLAEVYGVEPLKPFEKPSAKSKSNKPRDFDDPDY